MGPKYISKSYYSQWWLSIVITCYSCLFEGTGLWKTELEEFILAHTKKFEIHAHKWSLNHSCKCSLWKTMHRFQNLLYQNKCIFWFPLSTKFLKYPCIPPHTNIAHTHTHTLHTSLTMTHLLGVIENILSLHFLQSCLRKGVLQTMTYLSNGQY